MKERYYIAAAAVHGALVSCHVNSSLRRAIRSGYLTINGARYAAPRHAMPRSSCTSAEKKIIIIKNSFIFFLALYSLLLVGMVI